MPDLFADDYPRCPNCGGPTEALKFCTVSCAQEFRKALKEVDHGKG